MYLSAPKMCSQSTVIRGHHDIVFRCQIKHDVFISKDVILSRYVSGSWKLLDNFESISNFSKDTSKNSVEWIPILDFWELTCVYHSESTTERFWTWVYNSSVCRILGNSLGKSCVWESCFLLKNDIRESESESRFRFFDFRAVQKINNRIGHKNIGRPHHRAYLHTPLQLKIEEVRPFWETPILERKFSLLLSSYVTIVTHRCFWHFISCQAVRDVLMKSSTRYFSRTTSHTVGIVMCWLQQMWRWTELGTNGRR